MAVDRRPVMMVVTTDVETLDLKQVVPSAESSLVAGTVDSSLVVALLVAEATVKANKESLVPQNNSDFKV